MAPMDPSACSRYSYSCSNFVTSEESGLSQLDKESLLSMCSEGISQWSGMTATPAELVKRALNSTIIRQAHTISFLRQSYERNDLQHPITSLSTVAQRNTGTSFSDATTLDVPLTPAVPFDDRDYLPPSSTASYTTGSFEGDQEELEGDQEEGNDTCKGEVTTSAEELSSEYLSAEAELSQKGPLQGATRMLKNVLLGTKTDEQLQMSGLTSASTIQLGHERTLTAGCLPMKDVKDRSTLIMDVQHDDRGMMNVEHGRCFKNLKGSQGGEPAFLSELAPDSMNEATPARVRPAVSYLMPNIHSSTYYDPSQNSAHIPATFDVATNAVGVKAEAALKDSLMRDSPGSGLLNLEQTILFKARNGFPVTSAVDIAAVQSLRPRRRNVKISKDPQSVAARLRRIRISERIALLKALVPGTDGKSTAAMLDMAYVYMKSLQAQVRALEAADKSARGFDPRFYYTTMSMGSAVSQPGLA